MTETGASGHDAGTHIGLIPLLRKSWWHVLQDTDGGSDPLAGGLGCPQEASCDGGDAGESSSKPGFYALRIWMAARRGLSRKVCPQHNACVGLRRPCLAYGIGSSRTFYLSGELSPLEGPPPRSVRKLERDDHPLFSALARPRQCPSFGDPSFGDTIRKSSCQLSAPCWHAKPHVVYSETLHVGTVGCVWCPRNCDAARR